MEFKLQRDKSDKAPGLLSALDMLKWALFLISFDYFVLPGFKIHLHFNCHFIIL